MKENTAIRIRGLTKIFFGEGGFFPGFRRPEVIKSLDNISCDINEGEVFCLAGPNGAGKTTLIRILCGLLLPTTGYVEISGLDMKKHEIEIKRDMGLVSGNERSFYWRLTVRDNLEFFASLNGISGKALRERIEKVSRDFSIKDILGRTFQKCSSGEKQRVSIARAFLCDPRILLLDEPSKNIDPFFQASFYRFIKDEFTKDGKKTVVFATNNLKEAEKISSVIAILDRGQIKATGTMDHLRQKSGLNGDVSAEEVFKFYVSS